MKIYRHQPPPPPTEIEMVFTINDGWAIVAALREYADNHPDAANSEVWKRWADRLDEELRA